MLTRRRFLSSAATLAAAGVAGLTAEPAQAAGAANPLRRSTYRPLIGRQLTVTQHGRRTPLRLRELRDVLGTPAGCEDSFILQFSSPHELPDGLYTVSHPKTGTHTLFVSGVYAAAQRRYEIVVNRYRPH